MAETTETKPALFADRVPASEVPQLEDNTHPELEAVQTGAAQDPHHTPEAIAAQCGPGAPTTPEAQEDEEDGETQEGETPKRRARRAVVKEA